MKKQTQLFPIFRTNVLCRLMVMLICLCNIACSVDGRGGSASEYRNVPELQSIPDSSVPPERKPVPVGVESLYENRSRTLSDIEVVWAIPDENVEGYIINYGFEASQMDRVIKLKSANLEKFEDKNYGFVFRYVLSGIPLSKTVYIAISAYNGTLVSEPSKVFKVTAG